MQIESCTAAHTHTAPATAVASVKIKRFYFLFYTKLYRYNNSWLCIENETIANRSIFFSSRQLFLASIFGSTIFATPLSVPFESFLFLFQSFLVSFSLSFICYLIFNPYTPDFCHFACENVVKYSLR